MTNAKKQEYALLGHMITVELMRLGDAGHSAQADHLARSIAAQIAKPKAVSFRRFMREQTGAIE